MMRVLILVDCYLPNTKSSAKLIHDLAVEMQRRGHTVCVAAPDDSLSAASQVSIEEGISVLRVKTGRIKGASKAVRALNEVRLSAVLWKRGREYFRTHPCDLIVFYSPTIFFTGLVRKLKRLWGCPAYLVLRDIFPQWAVDAGILRKGLVYWFFRRRELAQYAVADVIGVQSPANLLYFQQPELINRFRLEVLYNWTTLEEENVPATNYRTQWGLEGKVVYFYGGNIGAAQDMDNLLRLARNLHSEPNVHILLVGEGSEASRLSAEIAAASLTNISLRPAVGQREYLGMLSEFDVGMISLDRNLKTQNIPGKMLGYMYYALPMLASVNPGNDLKEIVDAHAAGLVSWNGDDEQFAADALRLARDPDLRRRLGENGRALLESTFAVGKAVEQILSSSTAPKTPPLSKGGQGG